MLAVPHPSSALGVPVPQQAENTARATSHGPFGGAHLERAPRRHPRLAIRRHPERTASVAASTSPLSPALPTSEGDVLTVLGLDRAVLLSAGLEPGLGELLQLQGLAVRDAAVDGQP